MNKFIKLKTVQQQVGREHIPKYVDRYFNVSNISFSDYKVFENGISIEVKETSNEILKLITNE